MSKRELLDLARHQDGAVVVDVGWPTDRAEPGRPLVLTRGVAPLLLQAAAEALAGSR